MIRVKMASTDQQVTVPTEKFLAEIEKRPCLWDPTHRLFREENARKLAFRLIVGKLIENAPEEKKDEMGKCLCSKWNGIRDHYFNMKRDPSKMEKYCSNRYFQLLEFLDPTLPSSNLERENIKSAPTKPIAVNTKFVAIKNQIVHKTDNNFIASSQVSSSSSHAVKRSTSHLSSPTDEVSSTLMSHNRDPECDPKTRPTDVSKRNRTTGQPQTTVMIDGVEFEQVTLGNGEVIVKLKEEVLEDYPRPIAIDITKKKLPTIPMTFQENTGKQQADKSDQLGNQNDLNCTQAQLDGNQEVSETVYSDHGHELIRTQHFEQRVRTPSINELKITSTTTLASSAWVPLPNNELKITSTTTLASNRFHEITTYNENLSPNIKLTLKKAAAADREIDPVNDQKKLVNLGSVDDMVKSVLTSSNQVFQTLGNAPKSPDGTVNLQSDNKKEATIEESGAIEISNNEKHSNLTAQDANVKLNRPAKQRTGGNGPQHLNTELTRLGALSKADAQQHGSQHPNYGVLVRTGMADKLVLTSSNQVFQKLSDTLKSSGLIENVQSENKNEEMFWSCSTAGQRSPPNLTPIRVRTNRNTDFLKKLSNTSPPADDLNTSPNLTPKRSPGLDDSQVAPQVALQLTPGKMLKTNRNAVIRMNDFNDSSSDNAQGTQAKRVRTNRNTVGAPNKRIRTNRNEIIEEEPEQSKLQPSKPTDILVEDDESSQATISENHEKADSPDVDEDKSFLLSLLPEMKSMTETQNFDFRLAVMEALSRAK